MFRACHLDAGQKISLCEKRRILATGIKIRAINVGDADMAPITMIEGIRQAMFEEMDRDPAVFAIGEDIGVYGGAFKGTDRLIGKLGRERVIETPISEAAIIVAPSGMSFLGLGTVAEMHA